MFQILPYEIIDLITLDFSINEMVSVSLLNKYMYHFITTNNFFVFCREKFNKYHTLFICRLMDNSKHFKRYLQYNTVKLFDETIFQYACIKNKLDIAKWLTFEFSDHIEEWIKSQFGRSFSALLQIFEAVCTNGLTDVALWLGSQIYDPYDISNGIHCAYKHTHNNLAEKLAEFISQCNNFNPQKLFVSSCMDANLPLAKKLLKLFPEINLRESDDFPFYFVCQMGNIEMAKWLTSVCPSIDVHAIDNSAFLVACRKGHFDMVVWLADVYPNFLLNIDQNRAFISACDSGNIKLIKWLVLVLSAPPSEETINESFARVCNRGYLDVAMWLKESYPKIDIRTNNDSALLQACIHGHVETVKWLISVHKNNAVVLSDSSVKNLIKYAKRNKQYYIEDMIRNAFCQKN